MAIASLLGTLGCDTPPASALTSSNAINIYANVPTPGLGDTFRGGASIDANVDFLSQVADATYAYYLLGDGNGPTNGYETLAQFDPALSITLSTVNDLAAFSGGSESGRVMEFAVVPRPSTIALHDLPPGGQPAGCRNPGPPPPGGLTGKRSRWPSGFRLATPSPFSGGFFGGRFHPLEAVGNAATAFRPSSITTSVRYRQYGSCSMVSRTVATGRKQRISCINSARIAGSTRSAASRGSSAATNAAASRL